MILSGVILLGILLFAADFDLAAHPQYYAVAIVAVIACIPEVNSRISRLIDHLRKPSPKMMWLTAAVIFVLSARYFLLSAALAGRNLFPAFHDEHMYLLQARMLAHGRLWMPQHELADFFDSFFVLVKPVYAATYFPGTALFYVPGIWLNTAYWLTSILITAGVVAMLYVITTELLDGAFGWLAALLSISLSQLRGLSVMAMSHPAMLLLLLLTFWSYLRWRRTRTITWAVAIGIFSGWAAITRPLDAICLIMPIAAAMLWDLRLVSKRTCAIYLGSAFLGAIPLLSLQLIFNKCLTGTFGRTPITQYGILNFPGLTLGRDLRVLPAESPSSLPQVRDYYKQFLLPDLTQFSRDSFWGTWMKRRLEPVADVSLPGHLLFCLLPIGLIALRSPPIIAIAMGSLLLPPAYAFFPVYLKHYGLVAAPGLILVTLSGAQALGRRFPRVRSPLILAIATLSIASLPELRGVRDGFMSAEYLADINAKLAELEHKPAVVLFRYQSGGTDLHEEPVYNLDVAWPDDAPVIRAQDRGTDNRRIFDYYARHQPQRFFYRYDRTTTELTPLGYAKDLAAPTHTP